MTKLILHPFGRGLTPPLEHELEMLGARFLEIDADRPESIPDNALACVIWFYYPLRQPFHAWKLKRALARRRIPLFAWNRDAPNYLGRSAWRLNLLNRSRILDIYATHTLIDSHRRFADSWLYLPNAADIAVYGIDSNDLSRLRDDQSYKYDVSFIGSLDSSHSKEMQPRADFFAALSERLNRLGIKFLFRESKGMTSSEQVSLIRSSRINLNYGALCDYGSPVASGLPERCYGIPSAGGFLLCDKRTHARDDFTVGVNWAEFEGLDDCVIKIQFWLKHFASARDLAEQSCLHVLSNHTYANRAQLMISALEDWHTGRRGLLGHHDLSHIIY